MAGRKGSVKMGGTNDEEGWTCKLCGTKHTDEKAEVLECEICDSHFCRKCLNLSNSEYKLLTKRKDLNWYCPPCEEKAHKNIMIEKEIAERCKEYFSKYEERLDTLEQQLKNKADIKEVNDVKELLKSNTKSTAHGGEEKYTEISDQISEFRESEARRCNIIIINIEEAKSVEAADRKKDDIWTVQELCNIMDADPTTVKNVTRLGKREIAEDAC